MPGHLGAGAPGGQVGADERGPLRRRAGRGGLGGERGDRGAAAVERDVAMVAQRGRAGLAQAVLGRAAGVESVSEDHDAPPARLLAVHHLRALP